MATEYHPTIKVLREDSRLDKYPLWFNIPAALWQELFLGAWDRPLDEDGDPIDFDGKRDAAYVRSQYDFPVCLIY